MNGGLCISISNNQKQSANNVNHLAYEVFMSNTSFSLCTMCDCLEWILLDLNVLFFSRLKISKFGYI